MNHQHQQKYIAENTQIIMLLSISHHGKSHYQYVAVPADCYAAFKADLAQNILNIEQHKATLLKQGDGMPDESIKRYMEQEFGCNHSDAVSVKLH